MSCKENIRETIPLTAPFLLSDYCSFAPPVLVTNLPVCSIYSRVCSPVPDHRLMLVFCLCPVLTSPVAGCLCIESSPHPLPTLKRYASDLTLPWITERARVDSWWNVVRKTERYPVQACTTTTLPFLWATGGFNIQCNVQHHAS